MKHNIQHQIICLSYQIAQARANGRTARLHLLERQRSRLIEQVMVAKVKEQAA